MDKMVGGDAATRPREATDQAPAGAAFGRIAGGAVIGVLFMGSTLLTPLYSLYQRVDQLSALTLGLLYAVYVVGNLTALLFLGRLSDQVGRRPVALGGLALAGLSTGLFVAAQGPAWLFAGRVVSGCAVGMGAGAATAWITEFTREADRPRAASVMTACNFVGLAVGPAVAGPLAQYAAAPLRAPFWIYFGFVAVAAGLALAARETLRRPAATHLSLTPRLGVPAEIRLAFLAPAAAGFAAMAVVGFYAALGPMLIKSVGVTNRAVSAAIIAGFFLVAAAVIVATRGVSGRPAMLAGLAAAPPGLGLLALSLATGSPVLMLAATVLCGAGAALSYRGGLAVANGLAPAERRAEVASSYFICCFLGNSLPVIGVAALTGPLGAGAADNAFALALSLVAAAAIACALRFRGAAT